MRYADLLDRMKNNDPEAFLELTERYGWAVYTTIRAKCSDHALADRIYNETMNLFYHSLSDSAAEDPVEALLCALADRLNPDQQEHEGIFSLIEERPPEVHLRDRMISGDAATSIGRKRKGIWRGLGFMLFLISCAVILWCIAGFLMGMGIIPNFDLGYAWFNAHIFPLF